jgi:DNA-binding CsgD family transcriptional regulator
VLRYQSRVASGRESDALCERIYDAAIDAERWPDVLAELAAAADCAWAALLTRRSDAWLGWRISPSAAGEVDTYLRSEAAQRSITTERLFACDRAGFATDQDLFLEDEYRADSFVQWANAHGFHHGAATGIRLNTGDTAVFQVMRRSGERAFSPCELEPLDALQPHLARAAMLAARWKLERLRAAAEALALVGMAAVVLTADCRVMAANALAGDLGEYVIWRTQDQLALVDDMVSAKLRRQVIACARLGSANCASSFPAWNGAHESAVVVHVIPLKGDRRELFDGGLALVLFTQVGSPVVPNVELVRELFDLTAAEARVAVQLAAGRSIEEVACAHQVSRSTVQSQTKSILQKVGAHRQSELVARLGIAKPIPPRDGS